MCRSRDLVRQIVIRFGMAIVGIHLLSAGAAARQPAASENHAPLSVCRDDLAADFRRAIQDAARTPGVGPDAAREETDKADRCAVENITWPEFDLTKLASPLDRFHSDLNRLSIDKISVPQSPNFGGTLLAIVVFARLMIGMSGSGRKSRAETGARQRTDQPPAGAPTSPSDRLSAERLERLANPRHRYSHRRGHSEVSQSSSMVARGRSDAPAPPANSADRIQVPNSWERGPRATFRGGSRSLWLYFHRDADLACTNSRDNDGAPSREAHGATVIRQFRADQIVRIVPSELPDDGWGHDPTIRADFAEVRISALDAAVIVHHFPSTEAAARIFKRSPDEIPFWNAMMAAPEDELPRLVYADWLEERGDPAARMLHDGEILVLHGWTATGPTWEHRNQLHLFWRQIQSHMNALVATVGYRHFEFSPGKVGAALARFTAVRQPGATRNYGEWQGLSVTTISGEPVPPFVNYLLIMIAFELSVPEQIRAEIRRLQSQNTRHR